MKIVDLIHKLNKKAMKRGFKLLFCAALMLIAVSAQATIRIGIIGLDTSHSPAFVKAFNAENPKPEFDGFQVVAAYPYGSQTIKTSYERIPKYIEEVKNYGVNITSSIDEMLKEVDYVLLETNDGNLHIEQALKVFQSGKPVFIDKPIGANLAQAIAIFYLAEKYKVPVFSSSALRFVTQNQKLRNGELGIIIGADTYSPAGIEPTHADFAWYGIHGIESLFTIMGKGCVSVQRTCTKGADFVVGKWIDDRIGTFRVARDSKYIYGGRAITDKSILPAGGYEGYDVLLVEIVKFFKSNIAPVSKEETLEIFAFIEAADMSKKLGGKAVSMEDAMKKGQKEAKKIIKKLKF